MLAWNLDTTPMNLALRPPRTCPPLEAAAGPGVLPPTSIATKLLLELRSSTRRSSGQRSCEGAAKGCEGGS